MNAEIKTGWERERRVHFDEIVETYDRTRPDYPGELIEGVFRYIGPDSGKKALEIGAGTGKATLPSLDAGYDVTAVELGENMAAFLREKFRKYRDFRVVNSAFEDAALGEDEYDLIYAASAFHWVDAEIGCPKALRLLKRGGVLALLRYSAVPADGKAFYEEIQALYKEYERESYQRPRPITKEWLRTPDGIRWGFGAEFRGMEAYGFADVAMNQLDISRTFSADEYIAFMDTMSDHRAMPEADRSALYAGLRDVIKRNDGRLTVEYIFQAYMGRKP